MVDDFILNDCRLASHPSVRIHMLWHLPSPWRLAIGAPHRVPSVERGFTLKYGEEIAGTIGIEGFKYPIDHEERFATLLLLLVAYATSCLDGRSRLPSPLSEDLGSALATVRADVGLSQQQLADRLGFSRIALSQWERGRQPPTHKQLLAWCRALGLIAATPSLVSLIDISERLVPILRASPEEIHRLDPAQFERFVAERLDRMGYQVTLTGSTFQRDGGIDLIAVPKVAGVASFLLAGQVKHVHPDRKIGRAQVDRLLAWRNTHFTLGLFVTNTRFTRDAQWLAAQQGHASFLRLRDLSDLRRWLNDVFSSEYEWRNMPERIELAPGVVVDLPRPRIFVPG